MGSSPSEYERLFADKLNKHESRYGERPDVVQEQRIADTVGRALARKEKFLRIGKFVISFLKR